MTLAPLPRDGLRDGFGRTRIGADADSRLSGGGFIGPILWGLSGVIRQSAQRLDINY